VAAVADLLEALKDEKDEEVRRRICRALGEIAAPARAVLEAVVPALADVGETDPSEAVQTTALLALERARPRGRALRPPITHSDLAVGPRNRRSRKRKRDNLVKLKSFLALLDTCLQWPENKKLSGPALQASPELKENRKRLGLPQRYSLTSVYYHLNSLANVCKVDRIIVPEDKNQFSTFPPGVKDRLRERRPYLEQEIAAEEEVARRFAPPGRLAPTLPEPDVIA
jgi:hypothetical protein